MKLTPLQRIIVFIEEKYADASDMESAQQVVEAMEALVELMRRDSPKSADLKYIENTLVTWQMDLQDMYTDLPASTRRTIAAEAKADAMED